MSKEDYYSLLNVGRDAGADEIRKAYKRMAMRYHPDRNKGDAKAEEKFKKVSEAYEVLSDDNKRRVYDSYGHSALRYGCSIGANSPLWIYDFAAGDLYPS